MPSIDGGYYFLTVLVPVRNAWPIERGPIDEGHAGKGRGDEGVAHAQRSVDEGGDESGGGSKVQAYRKDAGGPTGASGHHRTAPIIQLRQKLAQMPTAMQTPFSHKDDEISAFSKSTRTHLARFAVIDRLGYNGYEAADPVFDKMGIAKPINTRSELANPYLLFAAEFDAPSGSRNYDLAVYLRELWDVMQDDLVQILKNCVAFEPDEIMTAADFIAYIKRCEIETTMPFNFYWMDPPTLPSLTAKGLLAGSVITGGLAAWGVWWLLSGLFWPIPVTAAVIAFLAGFIIFVGIRFKMYGDRPFPSPPNGDLLSVLKGLHVQTTFGKFVIENQAKDADTLHANFGAYCDENALQKSNPRHPAGRVYP